MVSLPWKLLAAVVALAAMEVDAYSDLSGRSAVRMSTTVKPRDFRNILPLPCMGSYESPMRIVRTACFLGPEQMVCEQSENGGCIAEGLLPVPVPNGFDGALLAAMWNSHDMAHLPQYASAQLITDRNGGLYDHLLPETRKAVFNALRTGGTATSPYQSLVNALQNNARLTITGLLVELADEPEDGVLVLGAAVLLARNEVSAKWKLTATRTAPLKAVQSRSQDAQIVKCAMDEVVGLALVTSLPVVISERLYSSAAVEGLLTQGDATEQVTVKAPYSRAQTTSTQPPSPPNLIPAPNRRKESKNHGGPATPRAMDVPSATAYLTMSLGEKRAVLRATGIVGMALPRPREGAAAVDALLIPLLDEEVAYEVLRRLGETGGDFAAAACMSDFESRKPALARQILQARQRGDFTQAKVLCDELNSLSTLRFNPINPSSRVEGEWDVEEWYWEQRKKAYGIIAA